MCYQLLNVGSVCCQLLNVGSDSVSVGVGSCE